LKAFWKELISKDSWKTNIPTLSAREQKTLPRLKRTVDRIYMNYISVGLSVAGMIVGLAMALKSGGNDGYVIALVFAGVAVNILFISRFYQRLVDIITKMTEYISRLEERQEGKGSGKE